MGQSVEPLEPSLLRGDIVCGDRMGWLLAINDGGGGACAQQSIDL